MMSKRGAVLVESALALPLILLFTYGSIQLGMVGLEQLTVDGGAFIAAHQKALLGDNLKNYQDAPTLAKASLPHLNSPTISVPEPTFGQAPTTDTTNFVQQYNLNNSNARHGGVSMIQPVQTVSFVKSTSFASLLLGIGNSISVTGIAIDPAFRLINGHGDIGGNNFNTTAAFATAADPLVDGNNAPPYFVGFNYILQCPFTTTPWTACAQPYFSALGLAEYLDVNNWGRPVNGVIPDRLAVFSEARLHQNKFASIANALSVAAQSAKPHANKAAILNPLGGGDVQCVYSFDNQNLGTYTAGATHIGDFPLYPAGNPAVCGP